MEEAKRVGIKRLVAVCAIAGVIFGALAFGYLLSGQISPVAGAIVGAIVGLPGGALFGVVLGLLYNHVLSGIIALEFEPTPYVEGGDEDDESEEPEEEEETEE